MDFLIKHNYGDRSFTTKVKRDDRFKKKITMIGGGSDPRLNRRVSKSSGGNRGNFLAKVQRALAVGFCVVVGVSAIYMNHANSKAPAISTEVPAAQEEDPNSTITNIDREKGFISRDMPRDYQDPNLKEEKAFNQLMNNESGFEAGRINKDSLACGVGQAWPCTKLYPYATDAWIRKNKMVRDGKWYLPNPDKAYEIQWAKDYIKGRYINAVNALYFWEVTSVRLTGKHWY